MSNSTKDDASPGRAARVPERLSDQLLALGRHFFLMFLVVVAGLSAIACIWRFLDLYETSVKAESVHARIAMERHQMWMEEMKQRQAQHQALTPEAAEKLVRDQIRELPAPSAVSESTPAAPSIKGSVP